MFEKGLSEVISGGFTPAHIVLQLIIPVVAQAVACLLPSLPESHAGRVGELRLDVLLETSKFYSHSIIIF